MRGIRAVLAAAMLGLAAHCGGSRFTVASSDAGGTTDASVDASAGDGGSLDGAVRFTSPVTLAKGETLPRGIAVDDTRLYWVDAEDPSGGPGSVRTMRKDGSGQVATVAAGQIAPLDIAVDLAHVYWSVDTGASPPTAAQCLVMTADKGTLGSPTCFTSGPYAMLRMALAPSNVIILAQSAQGPYVGFAPASGGMYANVAARGPSAAVAGTDSDAFLGNAYGTHVDSVLLPALTFAPNVCTNGCGSGIVVDLVLDRALSRAYWVTTMGQVASAPLPPPTTDGTILATVAGTPQRIARDASYLYVAAQPGSIYAVPTAGGAPITLASGENHPFGIAVDANDVYWTCADGTIRAVGVPGH